MKLYRLERRQHLPLTIAQAWEFFSNPKNLEKITPPELNLTPDNPVPAKMYPGMIVTYVVRPFPLVRNRWVTEITQVDEPNYFIDEQRFGPYKFWHHQHLFEEKPDGVEATDIIHYGLPFGPLGRMANAVVVRSQLERIFSYRAEVLARTFGLPDSTD